MSAVIGDTRYRGPLSKLGGNTSQRTKRAREMERNRPIRDHLPFLETLEHPPESSIPPHPPLPPPLSSIATVHSVRLINLISLFFLSPSPRKRGCREDSRKIGYVELEKLNANLCCFNMLFFFSLELSRKIGIGLIDKFLYFNRLILVFLKDTLLFLRIFRRETGNFVRIFVRKGFFF